MVYATYEEHQQLLEENTSMNGHDNSEDANSECYVTKMTHKETVVPISVVGKLTIEDLMKELSIVKQLVHDMKDGTTNELVSLKSTCVSIEASVKKLELMVVSNMGNGSNFEEREPVVKDTSRTVDVQSFSVEIPKVIEVCDKTGLKGKVVIDEGVGMASFENLAGANLRTMQSIPFIPDEWLKTYHSIGLPNETNQSELYQSQFKRTADMLNEGIAIPADIENVSKKLFQTPSPKCTPGQSSKYALTYAPKSGSKSRSRASLSKDKLTSGGSVTKKGKHGGRAIPVGAKLHFRPTYGMLLAPIEAQTCAYLFQKTIDPILMMENIVKVGNLTASRAELLCLLPSHPITELVLTLAAEKVRCSQAHDMYQYVWSLPPTFVADIYNGVSLKDLSETYCSRWMPAYKKLKLIYIPMSTVNAHWFLMIIDVEKGVIYHLDSYCSLAAANLRKGRMKKIGQVLSRLVSGPDYKLALGNKRLDFMNMDIIEVRGIPKMGKSETSGVWLLEWMHLEHHFDPNYIYGEIKENVVRMKTAARLMLGVHNELRARVILNTEVYINSLQKTKPEDAENVDAENVDAENVDVDLDDA